MSDGVVVTGQATPSLFESIKQVDAQGREYWSARQLGEALGYTTWQSFERVVTKAKLSMIETGNAVDNHFRNVSKMVSIGYGNNRSTNDIELTRYACYIIAQNGNAAWKPAIAEAQAYFAIQTRKQELSAQHDRDIERLIHRQKFTESDKSVSGAIMEKGISGQQLGKIKSSGDSELFGGKTSKEVKEVYGVPSKKPWANRAPNVVLAAKSLANEMTATKLAEWPIDSYDDIKTENDDNNAELRKALGERDIVPEKMQPAEDTERVLKRVQAEEKRKALESD